MEGEVPFPYSRVGAMDLPVQCEDQAERVLSDSVRRIGGNTNDLDTESLSGVEIDVVEAGAP